MFLSLKAPGLKRNPGGGKVPAVHRPEGGGVCGKGAFSGGGRGQGGAGVTKDGADSLSAERDAIRKAGGKPVGGGRVSEDEAEDQAFSFRPGPEVTMPRSMRRRRYQLVSLTSMWS